MKRYILHIIILLASTYFADYAYGQTNISGTWAGGAITGSYKLTGNTTLTGTISVSSATLTIDLNGYTLDRKGTKAADFLFNVGESRTLNIKDSSTGKTGKIKGGKGDRGGCALISGILNFSGGEVTECTATDGDYGDKPTTNTNANNMHYVTQGCGGAFFVNSGATLNMSGTAKITNCKTEKLDGTHGRGGAVWVAGTFNMSGGTISGCQASWGGAVFVFNGARNAYYNNDTRSGTFKMTGGTITECRSYSDGCGVYTQSNVEISGDAKITSNRPLRWEALNLIDGKYPNVQLTGGHGGAIYATGDKAVVTMSGGELSNNLAESGGAVMLWTGSTMTMTGGIMDGNYAMGKPSLGNGGALYLQGSTFNFNGGTLSNNVANRYGGAINTNSGATLNISGNCLITGNRASHGGGISQEAGECSLTLDGTGIEISNNEAHGHQVNISDAGTTSVTNALGNGGGIFIEKGTVTMNGSKINNNKASGHGGGASLYVNRIHGRRTTVTINGGEISNNEAQYGGGIDVYANFQSLNDTYNENDPYTGKSDLTVNFKAGTLSGNKASANGAGIYVGFNETYSNASMTIGTATSIPVISDNIANGNGGGFGMTNQGVITVYNMTASNNHANIGGAIWLGTGIFTLENGTFTNNQATTDGGGIYVGSGTFTIGNTVTLKGNSATNGNGGGIYLGDGNFTVNGTGNLSLGGDVVSDGNKAGKNGGAIYCAAPFTVSNNGQISMKNNSSTIDGGAVYCNAAFKVGSISNGILTMENNSAGGNGGAVYCNAEFTVNRESKINNNRASGDGGAVYVNNQNISLQKSTIASNSAGNGGALYVNGGSIQINDESTISSNNALTSGGAAFVQNGKITLVKNVSMSNNSATEGSGGVFYVTKSAEYTGAVGVTTSTGTMSNNSATEGSGGVFFVNGGDIVLNGETTMNQNRANNGGAIALKGGTFSIHVNSEIKNNSATNGGGLWVENENSAIINCLGGSFIGNTATGNGGALYAKGNFTFNFDANVRDNVAQNGGGLYIDGSVKMNFGQSGSLLGLIVGNLAKASVQTVSGESAVTGTGGGIYLNGGTLSFSNPTSLGVYNNAADYQAADIYASGSNTTIYLPYVKDMNLSGFDVPGSELYWVKDFYGNRYQDALLNMNAEIEAMIVVFTAEEETNKRKVITDETCLDLGYDLVFVTFKSIGLENVDNAELNILYPKEINENGTTRIENTLYRTILFSGENDEKIVGLPSGNWKFEVGNLPYKYKEPTFNPEYAESDSAEEGTKAGYVLFKRKDDTSLELEVNFELNTSDMKVYKVKHYDMKITNKLIPKVGGTVEFTKPVTTTL